MHSAKFMAKMTILLILVLNGFVLNNYVWPHLLQKNFFTVKKQLPVRRVAFAAGAVSVVSWLSVCALGVLDTLVFSYVYIVSVYAIVVLIGIIVALFVEKKEFN